MTHRKRSKRGIARLLIASLDGPFSLNTMMEAARNSGDLEAIRINSGTWSTILVSLKNLGELEVVEKAAGNRAAVYRLIMPRQEFLKVRKVGGGKPSPLKEAILEGIKAIPEKSFDRVTFYTFLCESSPGFEDMFHLDSVGAVLNRLGRRNEGVRVTQYRSNGNIYEKI